jgi:hypothetical protein
MSNDNKNIVLDFVKFHKSKKNDRGSITIGRNLIKDVDINNNTPLQFEYHKDTQKIILTPLASLSSKLS